MSKCLECLPFSGDDKNKGIQAENARKRALCCVRQIRTQLDLPMCDGKLDTSLKEQFGFGITDERIKEVAKNYEKIEATLKNMKLCNDSKNSGELKNRPKYCPPKIPTRNPAHSPKTESLWNLLAGGFFDIKVFCGEAQLTGAFFQRTLGEQAKSLIHEASHQGLNEDGIKLNGEEGYIKRNGQSGYYDECGVFISIQVTPDDRIKMMDAYSNVATENCTCQ